MIAVAACNSGSATPPSPSKSKTVTAPAPAPRDASVPVDADVSKLSPGGQYAVLCAPCHGAKLEGYTADHAPSLINPTFIESATDTYLKHSIGGGRPGTSMAAYSTVFGGPLDEPAIDKLVAYLRGQGVPAKPLVVRKATGNTDRGRGIYDSTCKSCHGDLATRGEAVQLANPNFLQEASDEFIRYAIVKGRPGTQDGAVRGQADRRAAR